MRIERRLCSLIVIVIVSLSVAPIAVSAESGPILNMAEAAARKAVADEPPPTQPRSKGPSIVTGALIGAAAALAITGWAAASYGENEGGKFCSNCMLQWSAVSVPVGAALGAGIGVAVAGIRSSAAPGARLPERQMGVSIATRF